MRATTTNRPLHSRKMRGSPGGGPVLAILAAYQTTIAGGSAVTASPLLTQVLPLHFPHKK